MKNNAGKIREAIAANKKKYIMIFCKNTVAWAAVQY
jgi:hypothetical protein